MRLIKIYTSLLLLLLLSATLSRSLLSLSLVVVFLFWYGNNASSFFFSFLFLSSSFGFDDTTSLNVFISLVRRNESNEIVRNIEFYLRRDVSLVNPPSLLASIARRGKRKREREIAREEYKTVVCSGNVRRSPFNP